MGTYLKFKNLLRLEKDATLTLKSEAGRASVTLTLDLGHILSEEEDQPVFRGSRNGPARQRRRELRAAAREQKLSAEKVESEDYKPVEDVEEILKGEVPVADEAIVKETDVEAEEPCDVERKQLKKLYLKMKFALMTKCSEINPKN